MMYEGFRSNLIFQPARTLSASAAFNKEVLASKNNGKFNRGIEKKYYILGLPS